MKQEKLDFYEEPRVEVLLFRLEGVLCQSSGDEVRNNPLEDWEEGENISGGI